MACVVSGSVVDSRLFVVTDAGGRVRREYWHPPWHRRPNNVRSLTCTTSTRVGCKAWVCPDRVLAITQLDLRRRYRASRRQIRLRDAGLGHRVDRHRRRCRVLRLHALVLPSAEAGGQDEPHSHRRRPAGWWLRWPARCDGGTCTDCAPGLRAQRLRGSAGRTCHCCG